MARLLGGPEAAALTSAVSLALALTLPRPRAGKPWPALWPVAIAAVTGIATVTGVAAVSAATA